MLRFMLSNDDIGHLEKQLMQEGFPELAMMEAVAADIAHRLRKGLQDFSSILVLAGPGNNGADGCAVLRKLRTHGCSGPAALIVWPGKKSPARETQERLLMLTPGQAIERFDLSKSTLRELRDNKNFAGPALVIDAVFGTGFRARPPAPELVGFMTAFGAWVRKSGSRVVAVDVPSGLDEQGHLAPEFHPLQADLTLAAGGPRSSLLEPEGADHAGRIECVDLGMRPSQGKIVWVGRKRSEIKAVVASLTFGVRKLSAGAHKNARGRVAVVGGSLAAGGATRLAAETALRFGAGYSTIFESQAFSGRASQLIKRAGEWVIRSWPEKSDEWLAALAAQDALVFGCGLPAGGLPESEMGAWKAFFKAFEAALVGKFKCRAVVVDGGGLVSFLKFQAAMRGEVSIPVILTPHPKEAVDMLKSLGESVPDGRLALFEKLCDALAKRSLAGALLLKGAYPLLASIEKKDDNWFALDVASPRLATAGSGDTLAGAVAGAALSIQDPLVALLAACTAQMRAVRKLRTGALASEIGAAMGQCWQEEISDAFRV